MISDRKKKILRRFNTFLDGKIAEKEEEQMNGEAKNLTAVLLAASEMFEPKKES